MKSRHLDSPDAYGTGPESALRFETVIHFSTLGGMNERFLVELSRHGMVLCNDNLHRIGGQETGGGDEWVSLK